MVITKEINGENINFCDSMAWSLVYRNQFNKDPIKIILPLLIDALSNGQSETEMDITADAMGKVIEELGFSGMIEIAWSMAKLNYRSLPDPITWMLSLGEDGISLDDLIELTEAAISSLISSKKNNSSNESHTKDRGKGETVDIDKLLVGGIHRGLSMEDTNSMTVGEWVDYVIEYNNMSESGQKNGNKDTNRKANQTDFDRF